MTEERVEAAREQAEAMAGRVPALLEGLAAKLGANAGVAAVFGKPVKEEGRTVIPVAQTIIGTGAGGGGGTDESPGAGVGAGGGAFTKPLGYIEVTATAAAFVPLQQPWTDAKLILVYTLLVLVVGRVLVRLVRG